LRAHGVHRLTARTFVEAENGYVGVGHYVAKTGGKIEHDSGSRSANSKNQEVAYLHYRHYGDFDNGSTPENPLSGSIHDPDEPGNIVNAGSHHHPADQALELFVAGTDDPEKKYGKSEREQNQQSTAQAGRRARSNENR
jgi:hypothetical protein